MRDVQFLTRIHDALQVELAGIRHIIRFRSPEDYEEMLTLVRDSPDRYPLFHTLRPLPIIRGFSCRLQSDLLLDLHPRVITEPDLRLGFADEDNLRQSGMDGNETLIGSLSRQRAEGVKLPLNMPASKPLAMLGKQPQIPWGVNEIKAPSVWSRTSGAKVKIAVIDTGIDYNHPDLRHAVAGGINFVEPYRSPIDDNGHGTHIAGTIAAVSTGNGVLGVAPEAKIYAVKAFDQYGTAYVSDIVAGVEWSIDNHMQIINMSFGMKTPHKALEEALRTAYRKGMVIVASSGNEGKIGDIDYPARYRNVLAVGATGKHQRVSAFSNRGRRIDIYAPGHKVISTWLNGCYQELSGTSMATSHVSGVIALLLALRPGLSPLSVKRSLVHSATTVTAGRILPRAGQVNAARCIRQNIR